MFGESGIAIYCEGILSKGGILKNKDNDLAF